VFFEAQADNGGPDAAQEGSTELYERVAGSSTVELSAPALGAKPANTTPEPARYWAASENGELAFFTSSAELTTASNTGTANAGEDLYQYNTRTEQLTDLSLDTNPADAATGAAVQGVVGASADGSYLYFVADGQLLSGQGVNGQPNLYVSHAGTLSFVATLSPQDARVWTGVPAESRAYLTPDGQHLAFESENSLTGYDNEDRSVKGRLDTEVYEYTAAAGSQAAQLVCASCDSGGGQPIGSAFIGVEGGELTTDTPFYQPRVLSNDGSRLFFSSPDRLAPGLTSPLPAIYEYENGGQHLIAPAAAGTNAIFLDASPSGNDVFFATRERLVSSDQDNLVDVYDARVEGGLARQEQQRAPARCSDGGCQEPPSAPPALPAAASETLFGAGNLSAPASAAPHSSAHRPRLCRKRRRASRCRGATSRRRHATRPRGLARHAIDRAQRSGGRS